jgi:hypothetical protein
LTVCLRRDDRDARDRGRPFFKGTVQRFDIGEITIPPVAYYVPVEACLSDCTGRVDFRGDQVIRRHSLFDPMLERGQHVMLRCQWDALSVCSLQYAVGAGTGAAVVHARQHEDAEERFPPHLKPKKAG